MLLEEVLRRETSSFPFGPSELQLHGQNLSGPIPAEVGQLTALQQLVLSNNQLTGPIPSQLAQLSSLILLCLSKNQLHESIPQQLSHLTSLTPTASPLVRTAGLEEPLKCSTTLPVIPANR